MRAEKGRLKKASYEQKEYLLAYMEENPDFANDRFNSSNGAHSKAHRWRALSSRLNEIGGANKNVNQWRKYWRDQKLHSKEREALIKASYPNTKPLSSFEERLIALISPAAADEICLSDEDLPVQVKNELDDDILPENISEVSNTGTSSTGDDEMPLISEVKSEVDVHFQEKAETPTIDNTTISIADNKPIAMVEGIPTPESRTPIVHKRKNASSSGTLQMSLYERKLLGIRRAENEWKKEYEDKLLKLRERELTLREREMTLREREFNLREKEFELKIKNNQ